MMTGTTGSVSFGAEGPNPGGMSTGTVRLAGCKNLVFLA